MPSDWRELAHGIRERTLSTGYCHLRIHYTADPRKDDAWARKKSVSYGGMDNPKWRREFELDYSAVEGQRVYPMMSHLHQVNRMIDFRDTQDWAVHRVIDYGMRHPTVCIWVAVDRAGNRHVFREYYAAEKTIEYNCQEILRLSEEPVVANWIDPATRQRIPLAQKNYAPSSIIDEFRKGLRMSINYADNSQSGYDKVSRGLLSTLAQKANLEGITRDSYLSREFFESYGLQASEFLAMASNPALTFDPSCVRVYKEMKNLRYAELLGDPSSKAAPEKVMDFEDDGPDCFSGDTEILTEFGWKYFNELKKDDFVMTVNLQKDQYQYQNPKEIIERDYSGEMVKLSNDKGEFLVTPNHRMVVYSHCKTGRNSNPKIVLAKDLKPSHTLKLVSTWKGNEYARIFGEDPYDFAEFLGWYVSEGCICKPQCPGRGYQVVISQKPGTDKYNRIMNLLGKLRWKWTRRGHNFYTSSKELWKHLEPLGRRAWNKRVPEIIKLASPSIIKRFLMAFRDGDGWTQRGHDCYATTSKLLADDLQDLILKIGTSCRISKREGKPWKIGGKSGMSRPQYHIWTRSMKGFGLVARWGKGGIEKEPYSGKVYCATVPNGTLVIRRNGCPLIVGNCVRYAMQSNLTYRTALYCEPGSPIWEARQRYDKRKQRNNRNRRPLGSTAR